MWEKRVFLGLSLVWAMVSAKAASAQAISDQPILYVGDSISYGNFGTTLDDELRKISSNVTFISSCGTAPANWLKSTAISETVCGFWIHSPTEDSRSGAKQTESPKIDEELKTVHPVITIVQLGTNMAAALPSEAEANYQESPGYQSQVSYVTQMMETIKQSGSECMWIDPPNGIQVSAKTHLGVTLDNLKTTRDLIAQVAAKEGCVIIDALKATVPPSGNNVHPGPVDAGKWADLVIDSNEFIPTIKKALIDSRSPASKKSKKTNAH